MKNARGCGWCERRAWLAGAAALIVAGPAGAEVVTAPGWTAAAIEHGLTTPSGAATDGPDLVLTDLANGRVVRLGADGSITTLHDGLPVGRDVLGAPTGPYKVQVRNGRVVVAQGWQDVGRDEGPLDHALLAIANGRSRVLARDFWNPYDFTWGGDGWYVADAGRNTLARLGDDGTVGEVFAFDVLEQRRSDLTALSPTEFKDDEIYTVDAVPTGVAARDTRIFVALFGGFPFVAGGGVVVSVAKAGGRRARLEVRDLDAPIDVAFAADGTLLVLEHGRFDLAAEDFAPGSGRLARVDLNSGERTVLASSLTRPVTVVPEAAGTIVVVQMAGQVLRLTPD